MPQNTVDRASSYAELSGHLNRASAIRPTRSDCTDITQGEFGVGVSRPSTIGMAAFGCHVPSVVPLCSKEQVIGSDAPRRIAMVENAVTVRDWTVGQRPGNAMRVDHLGSDSDLPIAFGAAAAPKPAAIARSVHLGPEPRCKIATHRRSLPSLPRSRAFARRGSVSLPLILAGGQSHP